VDSEVKIGVVEEGEEAENRWENLIINIYAISRCRTSYLMGQKGDAGPSDLTLEFFSGRTRKPPSHISNNFDSFPVCSPSLRALTEVPLPSQLGIPRTGWHQFDAGSDWSGSEKESVGRVKPRDTALCVPWSGRQGHHSFSSLTVQMLELDRQLGRGTLEFGL
ncbi:von willebrand ring finger domain-containing protein, partial [Moniliophthora roreri]